MIDRRLPKAALPAPFFHEVASRAHAGTGCALHGGALCTHQIVALLLSTR
ncbi:hypothetical protein XOCgx_1575 [Xanthomonas oryzae pv. oryzicola]|nr:hypothetical protein XOCgx_1575 [Xanthomonas oryzae pv. oryzicola]